MSDHVIPKVIMLCTDLIGYTEYYYSDYGGNRPPVLRYSPYEGSVPPGYSCVEEQGVIAVNNWITDQQAPPPPPPPPPPCQQ
jgi:hypothetical protein